MRLLKVYEQIERKDVVYSSKVAAQGEQILLKCKISGVEEVMCVSAVKKKQKEKKNSAEHKKEEGSTHFLAQ